MNAGEFTAAKGMKGVRREERDGGGEKRAGRRRSGKKRRRRRDPVFRFTYIKLHIFI